jgi:hypothetical protein
MTAISASSAAYYNSLAPRGTNWLKDAFSSILSQRSQGGMLGTLQNAAHGGGASLSGYANAFASLSQSNFNGKNQLVAQMATAALQERAQKQLDLKLKELGDIQASVQPKNVLDPFIYFDNGSSLDTVNNILTMSDGTKIDSTTGLPYTDPAAIIQMANGAYLDTQNNIMTMPDGTKIDTVTGLTISKTA